MQQEQPVYAAPQKSSNTMTIVAVIVAVILALALIGAVVWGFMQSSALKATTAELESTKSTLTATSGELETTKTDLASTSSDLDATKAELESTKSTLEATTAELETTKADLAKSQEATAALQARIDNAMLYVEVMVNFWDDTYEEVEERVKATGDSDLEDAYNEFFAGTSFFDDLIVFQKVLFNSLEAALK